MKQGVIKTTTLSLQIGKINETGRLTARQEERKREDTVKKWRESLENSIITVVLRHPPNNHSFIQETGRELPSPLTSKTAHKARHTEIKQSRSKRA